MWIFITALGIVLPLLTAWSWWGTSRAARWWTHDAFFDMLALVVFPSLGFVCLGAALYEFGAPIWLVAIPFVVGFISAGWGLIVAIVSMLWRPFQRMWGPRWYSRLTKAQEQRMLEGADLPEAAVFDQPTWTGRNLKLWFGKQQAAAGNTANTKPLKGYLLLSQHGVWFDPHPPHLGAARMEAQWQDIADISVGGSTLKISTSAGTTEIHMPAWRARRAHQEIQAAGNFGTGQQQGSTS